MAIRISHPTNRPNFTRLDMDACTVWFSYETAIAVFVPGEGTYVRENDWGPPTGKHINSVNIENRPRLTGEEFKALLSRLGI